MVVWGGLVVVWGGLVEVCGGLVDVWGGLECFGVVWGVSRDQHNSEWQGDFIKVSVFFTGSDQN